MRIDDAHINEPLRQSWPPSPTLSCHRIIGLQLIDGVHTASEGSIVLHRCGHRVGMTFSCLVAAIDGGCLSRRVDCGEEIHRFAIEEGVGYKLVILSKGPLKTSEIGDFWHKRPGKSFSIGESSAEGEGGIPQECLEEGRQSIPIVRDN